MENKSFNNKFFLTLISIILVLFSSCEKVITLDLKNSNQQVVVQGNVTNLPGSYTVSLNSTAAYYSNNSFPPITGAHARIYDNEGNTEMLTEISNGIYKTTSLTGIPGRKYSLEIITNNQTYTGSSSMPFPIAIDSLLFEPSFGRSTNIINGYRVICKFTDPVGIGNCYRVLVNSNDTLAIGDRNSRILNDKLSDGLQLSLTFRTKLLVGDTLNIQLQSIDKSTYDFYNTLEGAIGSASLGQFLSALPANPTSNMSKGGLGYFSAYSITEKTAVVK